MSAQVAAPLLRVRQLVKSGANGTPLLDIGELSITEGACVLLSGRNGAGKTTLLKILAGLEPPDRVFIDYHGETVSWREARARFRHDVIYLHQQPYLFDTSVADNVAYGLCGNGRSRHQIVQLVTQALAAAGLSHLTERNARELSGGERQRVAITRALVLAPRLLLLDEPLASLDEESRTRTCGLLHELKAKRIAVLLTSHERLSLTALTDYHYELSEGQLTLLRSATYKPTPTVVALNTRKRRHVRPTNASGN